MWMKIVDMPLKYVYNLILRHMSVISISQILLFYFLDFNVKCILLLNNRITFLFFFIL